MKTLEQYLERSSRNLYEYVYGDGEDRKRTGAFFKIVRFEKYDIEYFATIGISKDKKVTIEVRKLEHYRSISPNGKEYIRPSLKNEILFHSYGNGRKKVCIKHFKSMVEFIDIITSYIKLYYKPTDKKESVWSNSYRKSNKEITDLINEKIAEFNLLD